MMTMLNKLVNWTYEIEFRHATLFQPNLEDFPPDAPLIMMSAAHHQTPTELTVEV